MQVCVPTSDISQYGSNANVSAPSGAFGNWYTQVDEGVTTVTSDYLFSGGGGSNNTTSSGVFFGTTTPLDPGAALRVPGDFTVVGSAVKSGGQANANWGVSLIQRNSADTADVFIAGIGGSNTVSLGPYTAALTQTQINLIDFTRLGALRLQFSFNSPAGLLQTVGQSVIYNGYFTFPDLPVAKYGMIL